jgi:salicylate hydroxylase
MLPFMAQGACQAIEDAWILARELDAVDSRNSDDIARALRRYERARQERTTTVQTLSYRNRDIYHLPDGEAQIRRDDAMRSRSGGFADVDWLYGFDPTMG